MEKTETVGITIRLPKKTYNGLKSFLNVDCKTLNRLISACAINRLIDKGYLNEFGDPIELPHLDLYSIDFPQEGLSISTLREVSSGTFKKE